MKYFVLVLATLLMGGVLGKGSSDDERKAVEAAIKNHYFKTQETRDPKYLDGFLHETAWRMMGQNESGGLNAVDIPTFKTFFDPSQPMDVECKILSIDITKDAAAAKLSIKRSDGKHFIDYVNLLKINGKWMAVNKVFQDISQ
jgi:hypothetical protein